ncbi:hypothetical protein [uncultured Agrococcus sp.]|uniref:hypothetical protein n=1 Tax=uncultured Agrococcus sp. TaxID=382258 RepID=UPI0025DBF167|nr:hypothetical protein [uncultured Agrococcus sp.]
MSFEGWEIEEIEPGVMHAARDRGWQVGLMQTGEDGWLVSGFSCQQAVQIRDPESHGVTLEDGVRKIGRRSARRGGVTFGTYSSAGAVANIGGGIDREQKEEFTVHSKHPASQTGRTKTGATEIPYVTWCRSLLGHGITTRRASWEMSSTGQRSRPPAPRTARWRIRAFFADPHPKGISISTFDIDMPSDAVRLPRSMQQIEAIVPAR